jgi:hypothetical protein
MADVWNVGVASVDTSGNLTVSGTINGPIIYPSTDPLIAGAWWDNAGTLTKSTGS